MTAKNQTPVLQETERLVVDRTRNFYMRIAQILAELRDALADSPQADLAAQQARKLRDDNPTLRILVSELRRRGFLTK